MRRFPLRTLVLMVIALIAFVRMWCVTHPVERAQAPAAHPGIEVTPVEQPGTQAR